MPFIQCKSNICIASFLMQLTYCIPDEGDLVRDLWPKQYPRLAKDAKPQKEYAAHDLVPESLHDLMAWAYVRRIDIGDPARRFALVHADTGNLGAECDQVVLRFQGIVLSAELRPFGNWREYVPSL